MQTKPVIKLRIRQDDSENVPSDAITKGELEDQIISGYNPVPIAIINLGVKKLNIRGSSNTNMIIYDSSDTGKYYCHYEGCYRHFDDSNKLANHHRYHKMYICPITGCHRHIRCQQNFKTHVEAHYDIRDYQCEDCGKMFKRSGINAHRCSSTD